MKILLLGPQGSGKSTLGPLIANHYNLPFINIGSVLRSIPETSSYFSNIESSMNAGILVPWEIGADIISDRLSTDDCKLGYILDGWGRDLEQLEYFDPEVNIVVYLNISMEVILKRIEGRRECLNDGRIYNVLTLNSSQDSCEECGTTLVKRADDNLEALGQRLHIFYSETVKVIDYYKKKGILIEVNGEPMPELVLQDILCGIKELKI